MDNLSPSGSDELSDVEMWSFFVHELADKELSMLGAAIQSEQRQRAIDSGDHDAIISQAFEVGFERSGLGVIPWIEGSLIVCPGSLVSKSQGNHRCRFISIDQEWVWQSRHLITEIKRPSPGSDKGFRAIALIPLVEGMAVDVVSGKLQAGHHRAERVVSYQIKEGQVREVGQRNVSIQGIHP